MSMNLQCESKYIKMMGRLKATSLCLVPISISILFILSQIISDIIYYARYDISVVYKTRFILSDV